MAEIPTLEAASEDAAPAAAGGKSKAKLFLLVAVVVLALGGAGAWFFLGQKAAGEHGEAKHVAPSGPPIYFALDPPFVVNFEAQQAVRFLQVTVQVMSRDPVTVELLKANDPMLRNDLLMLFGNQKYETLASREGKEALRKEALETVRHVIKTAEGKAGQIEAVYFTSFVMQ